jgi:hypothetical protein
LEIPAIREEPFILHSIRSGAQDCIRFAHISRLFRALNNPGPPALKLDKQAAHALQRVAIICGDSEVLLWAFSGFLRSNQCYSWLRNEVELSKRFHRDANIRFFGMDFTEFFKVAASLPLI